MDNRLLNKIIEHCGTPEAFCFEYVIGNSCLSGITRMKEYIKNVNKIKKTICQTLNKA